MRGLWAMMLAAVVALAGCGEPAQDLFPVVEGRLLRYRQEVQLVKVNRQGAYLLSGLAAKPVDGRRYQRLQVNAGAVRLYAVEEGMVYLFGEAGSEAVDWFQPPRPVLPQAPEVGQHWQAGTRTGVLETTVDPFRRLYRLALPLTLTYTVESVDAVVSVPAGRFAHCVRIRAEGSTHYEGDRTLFPTEVSVIQTEWYAPGVGLVRSRREERTGSKVLPAGSFTLELVELSGN